MPAKHLKRINDVGTYSHIYNKGIENRSIFKDNEDYKIFLEYLKDYLSSPREAESIKKEFKVGNRTFRGIPHQPKNYSQSVELVAYSLRPDHFHLLLHQKSQGAIQSLLRSLSTRYSIYFNKKYQRNGSLFVGPYKSIHVKKELQLLYLTRYIHISGNYTSYPVFLGIKEASWVNPQIILSVLNRGAQGYKDFVEKYKLDPEENRLVEEVALDDRAHLKDEDNPRKDPAWEFVPENKKLDIKSSGLERRILSREDNTQTSMISKSHPGMPIFMGLSSIIMFLLLVGIGITNIEVTKAKTVQTTLAPVALAQHTTDEVEPSVLAETSEASPQAQLKTTIMIKIDDGSSSVNIRQKPSAYSKKVGQAKSGEHFELLSQSPEWFEIKLIDDSVGYITKKYALIDPQDNE